MGQKSVGSGGNLNGSDGTGMVGNPGRARLKLRSKPTSGSVGNDGSLNGSDGTGMVGNPGRAKLKLHRLMNSHGAITQLVEGMPMAGPY